MDELWDTLESMTADQIAELRARLEADPDPAAGDALALLAAWEFGQALAGKGADGHDSLG
jgi:hypothetical protein